MRLLGPYKQAEEGGVINKGTMGETNVVYHFSSFQALHLQELLDIHPLRTQVQSWLYKALNKVDTNFGCEEQFP